MVGSLLFAAVGPLTRRVNNSQIRNNTTEDLSDGQRVNGTIETMELEEEAEAAFPKVVVGSVTHSAILSLFPPFRFQTVPGQSESTSTYTAAGGSRDLGKRFCEKIL